ncbi:hypothetical protein [Teichococcus aestuarii]
MPAGALVDAVYDKRRTAILALLAIATAAVLLAAAFHPAGAAL